MRKINNYQEALDYIYSFIDFSVTRNLRYSPEKFNLQRMIQFMDLIGNPHDDYKVIHVAGTKGKGSICAILTSILTEAGYKTGFYSSPHMIEMTERFRIGDKEISKTELVEYCNSLKKAINQVKDISTFEIMTGIAFKYFSDEKVDFAVIEVGMGGRLDATNVVSPIISAISSISLDHTQILGSTISKIAGEKAGIIKTGIPVILSPQKEAAEKVIKRQTDSKKAELIRVQNRCKNQILSKSLVGQHVKIVCNKKEYTEIRENEIKTDAYNVTIPLLGDHQIENVMTSILVIQKLVELGWEISSSSIKKGIENVKWPGRFEIIHKNPLVIIDGAHNLDSFIKLRSTIENYLPEKKIILIFGVSEDKQVKLMLKRIKKVVHKLIITKSTHPRALEPGIIEKYSLELGFDHYEIMSKIENAISKSIHDAEPDHVIIAAGSLFVAGAVKEIIAKGIKSDR